MLFLAQTKLGATIEIIALLSGAGIIGYITAWLFYKSIYTASLEKKESEIKVLEKQIVKLNSDKSNLYNDIREKDEETDRLILEIKALKAVHVETVHVVAVQNKDEELINIAKKRHLLNYSSFGTATEAEKDDLKMISGIGPFIEERLHALDIYTFLQISRFSASDIVTINDAIIYFSGRIERDEWVAQAKELVHDEENRIALFKRISDRKDSIYYNRIGTAKKEEEDDLTVISGIGGWIKKKLNILDIYTFRQISNFNKEDIVAVTEAIEYFPGRIERDEWIFRPRN